jgi:hypothetical protein
MGHRFGALASVMQESGESSSRDAAQGILVVLGVVVGVAFGAAVWYFFLRFIGRWLSAHAEDMVMPAVLAAVAGVIGVLVAAALQPNIDEALAWGAGTFAVAFLLLLLPT